MNSVGAISMVQTGMSTGIKIRIKHLRPQGDDFKVGGAGSNHIIDNTSDKEDKDYIPPSKSPNPSNTSLDDDILPLERTSVDQRTINVKQQKVSLHL